MDDRVNRDGKGVGRDSIRHTTVGVGGGGDANKPSGKMQGVREVVGRHVWLKGTTTPDKWGKEVLAVLRVQFGHKCNRKKTHWDTCATD